MASSYKIKLSSGMKPYVGRVVRNGRVQKAFADGPGKAVGGCVRSALAGKKGQYGAGQIKVFSAFFAFGKAEVEIIERHIGAFRKRE